MSLLHTRKIPHPANFAFVRAVSLEVTHLGVDTTLVGRTPMPPLWALGYHQSRGGNMLGRRTSPQCIRKVRRQGPGWPAHFPAWRCHSKIVADCDEVNG